MRTATGLFASFLRRTKSASMIAVVLVLTARHIPYSHAAVGEWIRDQHQCKLWDPDPKAGESVNWTGKCIAGYATGRGVERWMNGPGEWSSSSRLVLRRGKSGGPDLGCTKTYCAESYEVNGLVIGTLTIHADIWFTCETIKQSQCAGKEELVFANGDYGVGPAGANDDPAGHGLKCSFKPLSCADGIWSAPKPGLMPSFQKQKESSSDLAAAARADTLIRAFIREAKSHQAGSALMTMAHYRDLAGPSEPSAVAIVEAKLAHQAGFDLRALYVLTLYLKANQPSASHYQEAFELYAKYEKAIRELQGP